MLLSVLLIETMHLYSRLASAIILQRRERANRALSVEAVTAAIAHELRTPLGAIALNASTALSQRRSNPRDLEEMDQILTDIETESLRAGAIISSIRELSKNTTDRSARTRIEDVARVVLRLLQHDLQINEVSVATEFQDNLPNVHLDGALLQQVLLNLVKNAIDAMRSVAPETRRLRGSRRASTVTRPYCCRCKTPDPGFLSRIESASSIRSLRQSPAVWDWGSLSVLRWSKTTKADCGSSSRTPRARFLSSHCQSGGSRSAE
jgi:hypothetical protein